MTPMTKEALAWYSSSSASVLENIAAYNPEDINGDNLKLLFEAEGGLDAGREFSIVDQCSRAAVVIRTLLDELEAKDKLNQHLDLAVRKEEGVSAALRRRIAEQDREIDSLATVAGSNAAQVKELQSRAESAEHALLLERQKGVVATDWISHDGVGIPKSLKMDELVYLKTRTQELKIPYPTGEVAWFHTGSGMDIIAYKRVENDSGITLQKGGE